MTLENLPEQQENCTPRRVFESLPPELIQHVARFLSGNDVACCLRPLCHATASALNNTQHKTVILSKWAPNHAYAARWGARGAMRSLPRTRREDLVRLTSASGSVQNLELAVAVTGCPLTDAAVEAAAGAGQLDVLRWLQDQGCKVLTEEALKAAAAGGHLVVCAWLRDQGCPLDPTTRESLESAAAAGRQEVCAWLLANGSPWYGYATSAAAAGGHVALMDWLLLQRQTERRHPVDVQDLVKSAARGCPLPVLQRLHREWAEGPGGWLEEVELIESDDEEERADYTGPITAAAAASSTHDWAAKVVWLQEEKGYPLTADACTEVTYCCPTDEEVLARLTWLRSQGCEEADYWALWNAANRGLTASLQYLLEGGAAFGGVCGSVDAVGAASRAGHLACLQALHAAGVNMNPAHSVTIAARGGHLPVVQWLVETPGLEAPLTADVAAAAAQSASLELLSYLHERGCPWDVATWRKAVEWGSEEMREWLRERGCPTQ